MQEVWELGGRASGATSCLGEGAVGIHELETNAAQIFKTIGVTSRIV